MSDEQLLQWAKDEAWPKIGLAVKRVIEERDRMAAHVVRLTGELQKLKKPEQSEVLVGFSSDGSLVEMKPAEAKPFDGSTGRLSDTAGKKTEGSGV